MTDFLLDLWPILFFFACIILGRSFLVVLPIYRRMRSPSQSATPGDSGDGPETPGVQAGRVPPGPVVPDMKDASPPPLPTRNRPPPPSLSAKHHSERAGQSNPKDAYPRDRRILRIDDTKPLEITRTYDVVDPDARKQVLARLKHLRNLGRPIILLVGPTNSGKTVLRFRLTDRATNQNSAFVDRSMDRTPALRVGVLDLPTQPVLVDVAGEDFEALGDRQRFESKEGYRDDTSAPAYFSQFLWPVLEAATGLIIVLDFPSVWRDFNDGFRQQDTVSTKDKRRIAETTQRREQLIQEAITNLLRMTKLSKNWQLVKSSQRLGGAEWDRTYDSLRTLSVGRMGIRIPVCTMLSKADVYTGTLYPEGILAPPLRRGHAGSAILPMATIDPNRHHPAFIIKHRFPNLWEYMMKTIDHPIFGFLQSMQFGELEASSGRPIELTCLRTMAGESLLSEVFSHHPWGWPPSRWFVPLLLRQIPDADPWRGS